MTPDDGSRLDPHHRDQSLVPLRLAHARECIATVGCDVCWAHPGEPCCSNGVNAQGMQAVYRHIYAMPTKVHLARHRAWTFPRGS